MAYPLPLSSRSNLLILISPSLKISFRPRVSIRAQRFRDDESDANGRSPSSDVVDANLGILRRRIKEAKAKEMQEQCCRYEIGRWDYANHASDVRERQQNAGMSESIKLAFLVFGNFGLTLAGGTLLLCIASLFIHSCFFWVQY